jgi:ribosome-associated translation inhibitor RaiA
MGCRAADREGEDLEIHWHQANWLNDGQKEEIEKRVHTLAEQGHNDLIDVRISGNPSRHKGHTENEVRITCEARGQEIVATRSATTMDQALHDALENFKQQVREMRKKRRHPRGNRNGG